MKFPEKKYINIVFILAFIILVSINIITYMNIRLHLDDETVVKEALSSIQVSESLISSITGAETSMRGYFITNDADFLNQYYSSAKNADSVFLILKKNKSGNQGQYNLVENLGKLIGERKKAWQESIEIQERRKKDINAKIEFTTEGKETINEIRVLVNKFQEEERNLIGERLNKAELSADYTITNQIIGSIVAYVLLILGVIVLNKNISKRKDTESRLWESRNWFATTLQSIGDGVIVTSSVGDIVYMNRVAQQLTGWKEPEAKGLILEHIFSLVDEKTGKIPKGVISGYLKSFETGKVTEGVSLKTKTGTIIPIEFIASDLVQDDDKALGRVYVFRDISERRKSESEIVESKRFIQRIADSIPSVIYIYKLNGLELLYVNYKVLDLLGYSSEYVMKMKEEFFTKLIHPDDMSRLASMFQKFSNAKDSEIIDYEYRIKNSKGDWRAFRNYDVVFTRDKTGNVTEMLGTAMDVTGQKKLEEEIKNYSSHLEELVDKRTKAMQTANEKLKKEIVERVRAEASIYEQQQYLKKVIDTNPSFVFAKDWNGKFTLVNKAVADNYGTTVDELIGKSDADFNHNKEEVEHFLQDDREVITGSKPKFVPEEVVSNSVTGESKWYQTIKVPLETKSGEVQVLGVATDITARKMAEELTKKSLHEKELLLKEIHHRVKNNLQIIISLLKLQSRYIFDERDLALFSNSRARVETMSMIHEKLYKTRDLSNIDLGSYMSDLVNNLINSQNKKPNEITLDFSSDTVLLGIDSAIPCGLIMNELLLSILNYSLNCRDDKFLIVHIKKIHGEIIIQVKDNGKGIDSANDLQSSNSLGFQLIDMLVKQLDGNVCIRNDGGTQFEMKFKEITYKERI